MYDPVNKLHLNDLSDLYSVSHDDSWIYLESKAHLLPEYGWKIHISSTPNDFLKTLERVSLIAERKRDTFKFPVNYHAMLALTTGGTKMESQGKMITIYPADQSFNNLKNYAEELNHVLDNEKFPMIRWDYQFKNKNIFFRFGGFKTIYKSNSLGYLVPAIKEHDQIKFDDRKSLSQSNRLEFLSDKEDENVRLITKLKSLGFTKPKRIVATSKGNSFVAYLNNKKLFIKQSYSNELVDHLNRSAADRLKNEYIYLKKANQLIDSAQAISLIKEKNESFLVEEFLEGYPLMDYFRKGKYYHQSKSKRNEFISKLVHKLFIDIKVLHENGIIFRDISPGNVVITNNGNVILTDYELANGISNLKPYVGATPGFFSIREKGNKRLSTARDTYGLGALIFYVTTSVKSIFTEEINDTKMAINKLRKIAYSINSNNNFLLKLSLLGISMMEESDASFSAYYTQFKKMEYWGNYKVQELNEVDIFENLKNYLNFRNKQIAIKGTKSVNKIPSFQRNQLISLDNGIMTNLLLLKNMAKKDLKYSYENMTEILGEVNESYSKIENYDVHNLICGDVTLIYIVDWYNDFFSKNKFLEFKKRLLNRLLNVDLNTMYTGFMYGLSGIGYALSKSYLISKDKAELEIVNRIKTILVKRIEISENEIVNVDSGKKGQVLKYRILNLGFGLAGVGIFLCRYLTINNDVNTKEILKLIYKYLLEHKIVENDYVYWKQSDLDLNFYPLLFSGTAGIGIFLEEYRQVMKSNSDLQLKGLINKVSETLLETNCIFTANMLQGAAGMMLFAKLNKQNSPLSKKMFNIIMSLSSKEKDYVCWTDPARYNRIDNTFLTGTAGIYYVLTV